MLPKVADTGAIKEATVQPVAKAVKVAVLTINGKDRRLRSILSIRMHQRQHEKEEDLP